MTTIFQPASRTHEAPTAVPRWRAVVWERIEADVMAMHSYGLRATIEEDRD